MNTLIVDDELVSRKTIQKIMMSFGECEAVESGSEAVTAFKQALENGATFNFITLDVTMPEMDGTEVLYEIRNIENEMKIPNENRVKILMVTSQADKETVITCIQAGCDDYITKPFDKGKLMVKLERMGLVVTKEIEEKGDLQAMTKETVKRFERDEIDLNVLIVDDLGNVRGLLRTLLKKLGVKQFHEATNGLEALRILESQHEIDKIMRRDINMVLCDINMPKMGGIEFLREIKKRKEFDNVAIIMIAGEYKKETIVEAKGLDVDGFIIKPYTLNTFKDKITKALERKKKIIRGGLK